MPVDTEPLGDGRGDGAADPVHSGEFLDGALPDPLERPEFTGQRTRRRGSDMTDGQRDQHPPQRLVLGGIEIVEQPAAVGRQPAGLSPEERRLEQIVLGEREQVSLVADRLGLEQARCGLVAEDLDVERAAARDVEHAFPELRGGSTAGWGQRMSASPSLAGASGVSHSGQWVGITNSYSSPVRASTTGPRTSGGMTSPALRSTTVSPMSTPLRLTSEPLCRVASETVEPATVTGSM